MSPREGVHHLLYDEVINLMEHILADFGNIVTAESIGKTYEGRDMWMLKVDATDYFNQKGVSTNPDKKAILMTGAHHSRELVSVQMPLYTVLDLLHGLVHNDAETLELLKRNKIFALPMVNVDGSYTIYDQFMKTGELIMKRKNNDRSNEGALKCELAV